VLLPSLDDGDPDWVNMDLYIKGIFAKKTQEYLRFLEGKKAGFSGEATPHLKEKVWGEFFISDLFILDIKNKVQVPTGANIPSKFLEVGDIPRVTVTSQNNGISGFYVSQHKNFRTFKNIISVSFLGTVFYHPYEVSLDMKVHCLSLRSGQLNPYTALFLLEQIRKSVADASYGNQISSTDLPKKKIMLPLDAKGAPDFKFMEKFIRNIEYKKLRLYQEYRKGEI
jgi:hypothetical protein